jgi:hypothetical protein
MSQPPPSGPPPGQSPPASWQPPPPGWQPPRMERQTTTHNYPDMESYRREGARMHADGWQLGEQHAIGNRYVVTWYRDVPAQQSPPMRPAGPAGPAGLGPRRRRGLHPLAVVGVVLAGLVVLLFVVSIIGVAMGGGKKATATPSGTAVSATGGAVVGNVAAATTDTPAKPTATVKATDTPKPVPTDKPSATPAPSATPRPPTNTPAPKPGSDVRVPLSQSNQGTADGHRITIVSIVDDAKSDNQFEQPHAGNKFIAVTVILENASPRQISAGSWKLRTNTDFEYAGMGLSGVGQRLPFDSITSGGKVQGVVVFEVPKAEKMKWLKYDPNPLTDGDLYFDA